MKIKKLIQKIVALSGTFLICSCSSINYLDNKTCATIKRANPFMQEEQANVTNQDDIIRYLIESNLLTLEVYNNPSNSLQSNFIYELIYSNGTIYIQGSKTDQINETNNFQLSTIKLSANYELYSESNYLLNINMNVSGEINEQYANVYVLNSNSDYAYCENVIEPSYLNYNTNVRKRNFQKGSYLIYPTASKENFSINFQYDTLAYIRWNGTLSERYKLCDISLIEINPSAYYTYYKSNPTETYQQGYNYGYNQGLSVGNSQGEQNGYQNGYQVGYNQGYAVGKNDVVQNDYSGKTYQQIFNTGYNSGYNASVDSGSLVPQLFEGIIDIPISALNGLMPLTFFDVSIIRVVITFLAFSIVLYLISWLMSAKG